jgi:hypothetical protein
VDDVLRHWPNLPTHHGGLHDTVMWYYVVNVGMHCVNVAMGIGTSIFVLFSYYFLHYENHVVLKMHNELSMHYINMNTK